MEQKLGILFDLDGTLIDNEHLKAAAFSSAIIKLGGKSDPDFYKEVMGMDGNTIRNHFIQKSKTNITFQEYKNLYFSTYHQMLKKNLKIRPEVTNFLKLLKSKGILLAVVSSASSESVNYITEKLELKHLLEVIISGGDVKQKKPNPECFLMALRKLGLGINQAIVFEDTEAGLSAACKAKIPAICIRHEYNQTHDLSLAVLEFKSFKSDHDLLMKKINSIFDM